MANNDRPLRVNIYVGEGRRSKIVCRSLYQGAHIKCDAKMLVTSRYERPDPDVQVAAFYGLKDRLLDIFEDYKAAGKKSVLVDLGYFGRHDGGRLAGYHKFTVNDHSPLAYFQKRQHGPDRIKKFGIKLKPMRKRGQYILLAGMSGKGAGVFGYKPEAFEKEMVKRISQVTNMPILYRPKPSWKDARPIEGTFFSPPGQSLETDLKRAYAVVTHHSNVAIDALIDGVPIFVIGKSVASPLARYMPEDIENPYYPSDEERQQLLNDIAYTQWSIAEMTNGRAWQHLINEGII